MRHSVVVPYTERLSACSASTFSVSSLFRQPPSHQPRMETNTGRRAGLWSNRESTASTAPPWRSGLYTASRRISSGMLRIVG